MVMSGMIEALWCIGTNGLRFIMRRFGTNKIPSYSFTATQQREKSVMKCLLHAAHLQ